MARRHKGKHDIMRAMGLCRYKTDTTLTAPLAAPDSETNRELWQDISSGIKSQNRVSEGSFWSGLGKDLMNGIFQWRMAELMEGLMEKEQDIRKTAETNDNTLKTLVVTEQAKLANKIEDDKLQIAKFESRDKRAIAQIEADAKVEMTSKREITRLFYPNGLPTGPRAV